MKSIISTILIAALFAISALPARAQADSKTISGLNGGTNNVVHSTANVYSTDISVPKSGNATFVFEYKLNGSGTSGVDFKLIPTDGQGNTNSVAANNLSVTVLANGTSTVRCVTNITCNGVPGYRLIIANATNSTDVTNIVGKVITKNGI